MRTVTIQVFVRDLQHFLNTRHAAVFFTDGHAEVWIGGRYAGAIAHTDDAMVQQITCEECAEEARLLDDGRDA